MNPMDIVTCLHTRFFKIFTHNARLQHKEDIKKKSSCKIKSAWTCECSGPTPLEDIMKLSGAWGPCRTIVRGTAVEVQECGVPNNPTVSLSKTVSGSWHVLNKTKYRLLLLLSSVAPLENSAYIRTVQKRCVFICRVDFIKV